MNEFKELFSEEEVDIPQTDTICTASYSHLFHLKVLWFAALCGSLLINYIKFQNTENFLWSFTEAEVTWLLLLYFGYVMIKTSERIKDIKQKKSKIQ